MTLGAMAVSFDDMKRKKENNGQVNMNNICRKSQMIYSIL